jgi:hypothetical protein
MWEKDAGENADRRPCHLTLCRLDPSILIPKSKSNKTYRRKVHSLTRATENTERPVLAVDAEPGAPVEIEKQYSAARPDSNGTRRTTGALSRPRTSVQTVAEAARAFGESRFGRNSPRVPLP